MIMPPLLRSWLAIYGTRSACGLIVLAIALALTFTQTYIESFVVDLSIPVPTILLIPGIASVGFGIGMGSAASSMESARPFRLMLARATWALVPLLLVALLFGTLIENEHAAAAVRNFVFLSSVSILAAVATSTMWAWLPAAMLCAMSLFFGQLDGHVQPWAFIVDPYVTPWQLVVTGTFITSAVIIYSHRGARAE